MEGIDKRKFNKGTAGNKGGRRPTEKEEIWHSEKWEIDSDVPELQAKLKTGKYSVRDVFLAKALQGNERILGIFANKLLADLVDVRGKGGGAIVLSLSDEEKDDVKRMFSNGKAIS